MRNEELVREARALKSQGWANTAIASRLGVTKSYISRWCIEISDKRLKRIIDFNQKRRDFFFWKDRVNIKRITPNQARLLTALLYWCEGSKYPAKSRVSFTTSDVEMQKLFINLLRKAFKVNESKFRVWLQLHTDHDRDRTVFYWSESLKIPPSQFIKPRITQKKGGKYRNIYYGTCALRYNDYSILLRLMGIYKRFAKQAIGQLI